MHNFTWYPAYFHIHFQKEIKRKICFFSMLYCPLSFLFCGKHCVILLDIYERNIIYHFISHLYIVISSKIESFTLCTSYLISKMQQPPKSMFSCYHLHTRDEHGLSLGMLMHVKCIHELCSLLSHIPTYMDLIYCYIHVLYWFLGINQWFPLFGL